MVFGLWSLNRFDVRNKDVIGFGDFFDGGKQKGTIHNSPPQLRGQSRQFQNS